MHSRLCHRHLLPPSPPTSPASPSLELTLTAAKKFTKNSPKKSKNTDVKKKRFALNPNLQNRKKSCTKSQKIHAQGQPELKNQRDKASSSYKHKTQD
jgi:hypothetical protein